MSLDKIEDLLDKAWNMPEGDAKIGLLLEAVQFADALGDIEVAFDIRNDLMEAANAWGRPEHELVAFAWCLAQFDANPKEFGQWRHALLWTYKRVLSTLWSFPHISSNQIESALSDFKARLEKNQLSLGTYHEFALKYAFHLGDTTRIEQEYKAWRTFKPKDLDCAACWQHLEVQYQIYLGNLKNALTKAEKLFGKRAASCNRVPHVTRAAILEPMLKLGQLEAATVHHQLFKKIAKDEAFLRVATINLAYLAYSNQVPAATKMLETHIPWAFKTLDLERRFDALRDTLPLFERFKQNSIKTIKLKWNKENPLFQGQPEHDTNQLETAILEEIKRIAALFDTRNQNAKFTNRIGFDTALLEQYNDVH
jgi:hypothetical protein